MLLLFLLEKEKDHLAWDRFCLPLTIEEIEHLIHVANNIIGWRKSSTSKAGHYDDSFFENEESENRTSWSCVLPREGDSIYAERSCLNVGKLSRFNS